MGSVFAQELAINIVLVGARGLQMFISEPITAFIGKLEDTFLPCLHVSENL